MKLVVEFDCDADIIEVPAFVVKNKDIMRRRFLKWLTNKCVKHKYWIKWTERDGRKMIGLQYRSDAFVEWLNKKVLCDSEEKASIIEQFVGTWPSELPSIFF